MRHSKVGIIELPLPAISVGHDIRDLVRCTCVLYRAMSMAQTRVGARYQVTHLQDTNDDTHYPHIGADPNLDLLVLEGSEITSNVEGQGTRTRS